nr:hypothetical protein [Deltaproteobacteria bacterium]
MYRGDGDRGIGASAAPIGLHVFEDLVVIEPADEHDRPVPTASRATSCW